MTAHGYRRLILTLTGGLIVAFAGLSTGCDSNSSRSSTSVYAGSSYYRGPGYYDPWYHRPYSGGGNTVIVNPPEHRPPVSRPPVNRPVRPAPMPTVPARPRPRGR